MGDGILAYFGYPKAHEDEAERAVRAGLHLVRRVGQLVVPSGEPLKVRVAIATGTVVVGETVGEGPSQEQTAVGETPNLAARLQNIASPNTVVITMGTRRLLGGVFALEELGLQNLRGISEPVPVWQVIGERPVVSRFDAIRAKKLTQFVGRHEELRHLMAALGMRQEGRWSGCSPMRRGWHWQVAHCQHAARLSCRRSPCHCEVSVLSVSHEQPVLSGHRPDRVCGTVRERRSAGAQTRKLEKLLARSGPKVLSDIGLYAALLSLPTGGRYPGSDLTPQRQKELTIESLIRQLLNLTSVQPVLFICRGCSLDRPDYARSFHPRPDGHQNSSDPVRDHVQTGILSALAR